MGVFQHPELTWQLRGQSGARQVPNAKVGRHKRWGWAATRPLRYSSVDFVRLLAETPRLPGAFFCP